MEIGVVKPITIEEEMKGAYLDYAMSVITSRALPDVRDGLKPVQRRILYAMDELSLRHTNPYKKSARIVGEVLGKYHPHGDSAVYEAMVRMAQEFSMRYMLVDGQGNFGSVDGDPAAAMRYTEARLAQMAEEMLADIDKNTVDFVPNFDDSLKEPSVLPARLPNLLINGVSGIAVGMATNIPPHNLSEVSDAMSLIIGRIAEVLEGGVSFNLLWSRILRTKANPGELAVALEQLTKPFGVRVLEEARKVAARPTMEQKGEALVKVIDDIIDIPPDELMAIVKGPDFPTAGAIIGVEGIKNAYTTGHGRITLRARAHVEDIRGGRSQIVVTELPYQVNKATLLGKIADLVRDKRVEGISDLRDESDRHGMRMVIELKRDAQAKQILNQLYKYTQMQGTFSINMLALVDGQPRVMTLKMLLMQYIKFRREVVTRRTEHELARARHRAHILEGLKIALDNLDEVIATIRRSRDADTARTALIKNFKLSEIQAQAILDMQLRRLAALERKKILDEYAEVLKLIAHLEDLLAKPAKILYLVRDEVNEIKEKYGDERRTRILAEATADFSEEDLIPDQEVTVALTAKGYIKRMAAGVYRVRRGGTGATKEDDAVQMVLSANMLDTLLLFTNRGRVFPLRVRDLSDASVKTRGVPLSTLVQFDEGEQAVAMVPTREPKEGEHAVLVTRAGNIKRVSASDYSSSRSGALITFNIAEGDELGWAEISSGKADVTITTAQGQNIRFSEEDVRPSGRTSGGVRAVRLGAGDQVIGMSVIKAETDLLIVSRNGYAKRSPLTEYPVHSRGGGGVRAVTIGAKNGPLVAAYAVRSGDSLVITTGEGLVSKLPTDEVPSMSRAAQGAPIITLDKGDTVSAVSRLEGREQNGNGNVRAPSNGQGDAEQPKGKAKTDNKSKAKGSSSRSRSGGKTASNAVDKAANGKAAIEEAERIFSDTKAKSAKQAKGEKPVKRTKAEEQEQMKDSGAKKAKAGAKVTKAKTGTNKSASAKKTAAVSSSVEKKAAKAAPKVETKAETTKATKTKVATVSKVATVKTAASRATATAGPQTSAKPSARASAKASVKKVKAAQPELELAVEEPAVVAPQPWRPLDDGERAANVKRTVVGRASKSGASSSGRRTKAGPAKDESKNSSLIGSIASKLSSPKKTTGKR